MSAAIAIHPWERGGHLKAPFRVVGFSVRKYKACEGAPCQPGGSCFICGTGIMNVFTVRDANGFEFIVGSDCVQKVDAELHSECKALFRAHKHEAKVAAFRQMRVAREASERAANKATGRGEFTDTELRIKAREAQEAQWAQEKAEREAARETERLASKHVGAIGKRIELTLTCTFKFVCEPGPYGRTVIFSLQDADKNVFVVKTTSGLGMYVPLNGTDGHTTWQGVGQGDKVTLKGTIKTHGEYKGCKQTQLARCKVSKIVLGES